jgi:multidrug efflux pump subunit AcrB
MIILVVALIGGGALALARMRIDIFPPINQALIYEFTIYGGHDPFEMEGLLVSPFELWFQLVNGVRSMESTSIQQVAVIKLSFYPDTDMSKAMAQVLSVASRAQATQPDGTLPPLIMQMDAGNVPVGYLVFRSQTHSPGELCRIRPGSGFGAASGPEKRNEHNLAMRFAANTAKGRQARRSLPIDHAFERR